MDVLVILLLVTANTIALHLVGGRPHQDNFSSTFSLDEDHASRVWNTSELASSSNDGERLDSRVTALENVIVSQPDDVFGSITTTKFPNNMVHASSKEETVGNPMNSQCKCTDSLSITKRLSSKFECWSTPADLPHFQPTMEPCFWLNPRSGPARCRCSENNILDCSSNFDLHPPLHFLPKVKGMSMVNAVNFSTNGLLRVTDVNFFTNVSGDGADAGPWLVDLYNNNMTDLPRDVFGKLSRLSTVLIGGNRLNYATLRDTVFHVPTLRKLDIKCGGLGVLPPDYFNDTPAAQSLQYIDLSWNFLRCLDMHVLQPLTQLKNLTVWHNKLYDLTTAYMPELIYMSFHKNGLPDFPQTCLEKSVGDGGGKQYVSMFPKLEVLDLNFNLIDTLVDPICLPSVTVLNLQYNQIQRFPSYMFSLNRFPSLTKLELNQIESQVRHAEPFTFNNSALRDLTFALNRLDFASPYVSEDFFAGCSQLRKLELYGNVFRKVPVWKFQRLFEPLPSLDTLFLDNCNVEFLTKDHFQTLKQLQSLSLEDDEVSSLPAGVFDELTELKHLSMTNNHITTISSDTFSPQIQARLSYLDLSGNPFHCTCDLVWFQQWLRSRPDLFVHGPASRYMCSSLPNVTLQQYTISPQACLLTELAENNIIIFIGIFVFIFFVVIVVYGYRWDLRLWLYEACHEPSQRRGMRWVGYSKLRYRYDVFIAYAEEDSKWVYGELLPVLENLWNLRVCVHQRDFIPGKHIVDNIASCVEDSDRLMMVLSPHFARSPWCQFELRFCQTCAMDRDDVMVLLTLDECESRDMTGAMLAVLRTTTYIEWAPQPPSARESFWGRLRLALTDIIDNVPSSVTSSQTALDREN